MRRALAPIAIAALLTGCAGSVSYPTYDASLLERCVLPEPLSGLDGAAVLRWAEKAGPQIVDCHRNHNALVDIIGSQKEKGP